MKTECSIYILYVHKPGPTGYMRHVLEFGIATRQLDPAVSSHERQVSDLSAVYLPFICTRSTSDRPHDRILPMLRKD